MLILLILSLNFPNADFFISSRTFFYLEENFSEEKKISGRLKFRGMSLPARGP